MRDRTDLSFYRDYCFRHGLPFGFDIPNEGECQTCTVESDAEDREDAWGDAQYDAAEGN